MTHVVTVIEPTQAIRDWLRAKPTVISVVAEDASGKVAVYAGGLPKSFDLPAIVVHRVGGAIQDSGPVDEGLYQFDCWANKASDASIVGGVLASLLLSTGPELLTTGLRVCGANVSGMVYFPDEHRPDINRLSVTAQVVTRTES